MVDKYDAFLGFSDPLTVLILAFSFFLILQDYNVS